MTQHTRFARLEPELRKAHLLEATPKCLEQHGFQGASISKIFAEAGVSVGLINHHHGGKDELVAEACLTVTGRVMGLLQEAVDQAEPTPRGRCRLSSSFVLQRAARPAAAAARSSCAGGFAPMHQD